MAKAEVGGGFIPELGVVLSPRPTPCLEYSKSYQKASDKNQTTCTEKPHMRTWNPQICTAPEMYQKKNQKPPKCTKWVHFATERGFSGSKVGFLG